MYCCHIFGIDNIEIITPSMFKAGANEKTLLQKQNWVQDAKNVFGKFQKHILVSGRRFCVFNICCVGSQTRKHLRNPEEALTFNVSRLFPHLRAKATYSEDVEFTPGKQKCFASFLFAQPCNIVINIDQKCFRGNVSSFAPTFSHSWRDSFARKQKQLLENPWIFFIWTTTL